MTPLPQEARAEWCAITHWQQETICLWWGMPLFVGERMLEAYGAPIRSATCAMDHQREGTNRQRNV